ncbi:MAG: hypothetical protein ACM4AI_24425 [Acidobacteriota bacterium]
MTLVHRPLPYVGFAAALSFLVSLAACGGGGGGNPPPSPTLASITLASNTVNAGATVQGTASLDRAAGSGGANVSLTSSNASIATVPVSVVILEGSQSATFAVTGVGAGSVTITGNFGGSRTATLTVNAAPIDLVSVTLSTSSITAPGSVTGTVTISGPAPSGGTTVSLSSSNANVTVPSAVSVTSGSTSANFTVTVAGPASGNVTITGTLGGTTRSANLAVGFVTPEASFVVRPNAGTIATGEQCEVQSQPAPGGGSVNLMKCTFDASASKGNITQYIWRFPQNGSVVTFARPDPTISGVTVNCGSFGSGNVGTVTDRNITLEIQTPNGNNQINKPVTFIRNGPCG